MDARLPAHLEVGGLIRATQAAGGFAMVLHKGDRDAGTILVVLQDRQGLGALFERLPQRDGSRKWSQTMAQDIDSKQDFNEYLNRRISQDSDVWIVELTIADGERLVLNPS